MKKGNIFRSLTNRKFLHGGYAVLLILAVLAVVIVVNLVVDQIPLKLDITENKLFSISEQTQKILQNLTKDVEITLLAKAGQEPFDIVETVEKYAAACSRIRFSTIDPDRNPGWAKPFLTGDETLSEGSVVVSTPDKKKFKTIQSYQMYDYTTSNQTGQTQISSLAIEQRLTSAILYVTSDKNPVVYYLLGHDEQSLGGYSISTAIQDQNYAIKPLTLLMEKAVPEDADILAILNPQVDLSREDAEKVLTYLKGGGRLFLAKNLSTSSAAPLTNLEGILSAYGVALSRTLVIEGDSSNTVPDAPFIFIPQQEPHEIINPITDANYPILLYAPSPVETLELKKRTLTVSPLLSTSQNSWAKRNYDDLQRLNKAPGDIEGPFALAVAVEDKAEGPDGADARLVVIGNIQFMEYDLMSQAPGNADFILNSFSWLRNRPDTISIQTKSLLIFPLRLNATQALVLAGITAILIPLLVLGVGLFMWLRRRHL